jgi:phage terminase large subunit-like protein
MQISKLEQLYEECRHLPHYQYRDMDDEEFSKRAVTSFGRLNEKNRNIVLNSWSKKLGKSSGELDASDIRKLVVYRFAAQTNLYFLCHLLEKYDQTTLQTHEEICNDFFVHKDPTFSTFEAFANQYSDLKERLLLVPRGGYKSSIDIADCVQWTICFPAITILILTGVYKLSGDFLGEAKQHFTHDESGQKDDKGDVILQPRQIMDKKTGEWSDSMFQVLFSEHCIPPNTGTQFEFQTPAGGDDKEPTIRAASIEQALSGMHFGVLKLDDVVTNENSQNQDRIRTINNQISINKAMLNPYGFFDLIGTWYDEFDQYGITVRQEEKFAEEEGLTNNIHGSVDSGIFNSSVFVKVYLRSAWWPTDEAKKSGKVDDEMTKSDYVLWFPERLNYEFLEREWKRDEGTGNFAIKYLNNPRKINNVKFPRELLVRRTIPHYQFPQQGIVVTAVDTAYSVKSWADYTVAMTALIFGGRFYVINMVRGKYNEYDLPKVIANVGYKWKPKRIAIEDSVGVKWMGRELRREMDALKISIPVEFCSLGYGTKLRSKQLKAKPVLRLLGDERLYFLNSCEGLAEIYTEMEQFTGTSDDKHDDIVSAISLLVEQFGGYADMDRKISIASSDFAADAKSKARHDMIYCAGEYASLNQNGSEDPKTAYALLNSPAQQVQEKYADPFSDLMG